MPGSPGDRDGSRAGSGGSADETLRLAQLAIDKAVDGILWVDRSGTVQYANEAAARLSGYAREKLVGLSARVLEAHFDEERFLSWWRAAPGLGSSTFEGDLRTRTGHFLPVEMTASYLRHGAREHAVISIRDIAERKRAEGERSRMEVQLRHQQKLESVGTLASGVAHQINNPINVVMNYAELILARADQHDAVKAYASEILAESQRIASIVKELLASSRKDDEGLRACRVADVVAATLGLVGGGLEERHILLVVDVPDALPLVRGRPQELQQVLASLVDNARDALEERYPGAHPDKLLRVEAGELLREAETWVRVTVEDHGIGIPKEAIVRVFDPFFTSKPRARSTGLGLSISHAIVKEHRGDLSVESELGRWTRVHVDLPLDASWTPAPR
jgi:PAS domain S-box-containing protein